MNDNPMTKTWNTPNELLNKTYLSVSLISLFFQTILPMSEFLLLGTQLEIKKPHQIFGQWSKRTKKKGLGETHVLGWMDDCSECINDAYQNNYIN